jgi:hypothetical protein
MRAEAAGWRGKLATCSPHIPRDKLSRLLRYFFKFLGNTTEKCCRVLQHQNTCVQLCSCVRLLVFTGDQNPG